jgi:hypothetical protein
VTGSYTSHYTIADLVMECNSLSLPTGVTFL